MNLHCASRLGWIRSLKRVSSHAPAEAVDPTQASLTAAMYSRKSARVGVHGRHLLRRGRTLPWPRCEKRGRALLLMTVALLLVPVFSYADLLTVSVRSLEQTVVEGGTGSGSPDPTANATFEVKLDGGTGSGDVTVTYALSGTATGATDTTEDYTKPSGSVEIVAGATTGTITVVTNDDEVLEGDETVTVTLTHASTTAGTVRLGTPTEATTTIVDRGGVIVSVIADDDSAMVTEGEAQTFTVMLSGAVSTDVTVGYATADGTAKADTDYIAAESPATVVIAAGQEMGKITVDTVDNTLAEADERFAVMLTLVRFAGQRDTRERDRRGDDKRRRYPHGEFGGSRPCGRGYGGDLHGNAVGSHQQRGCRA